MITRNMFLDEHSMNKWMIAYLRVRNYVLFLNLYVEIKQYVSKSLIPYNEQKAEIYIYYRTEADATDVAQKTGNGTKLLNQLDFMQTGIWEAHLLQLLNLIVDFNGYSLSLY